MTTRSFDPKIIIRAHKFRASEVGFSIVRGAYMDRDEDRADRYYLVPHALSNGKRTGSGFKTIKSAADEAVRLGACLADSAPSA